MSPRCPLFRGSTVRNVYTCRLCQTGMLACERHTSPATNHHRFLPNRPPNTTVSFTSPCLVLLSFISLLSSPQLLHFPSQRVADDISLPPPPPVTLGPSHLEARLITLNSLIPSLAVAANLGLTKVTVHISCIHQVSVRLLL